MESPTIDKPDTAADLDAILSTYNKAAQESTPTGGELFPGDRVSSTAAPNQGTPFSITHDPAGSDPKQEYYKRGAKKGLPKPAGSQSKPKPTTIVASSLITGSLFITMIDIILPMVFAGLNNWRSKVKVDSDKMKMTQRQKDDLAPIGDAVVKELNINANPVALLLIGLGGIYGGNLVMLRNEAEKEMKKAAEKAKKEADEKKTKNYNFNNLQ